MSLDAEATGIVEVAAYETFAAEACSRAGKGLLKGEVLPIPKAAPVVSNITAVGNNMRDKCFIRLHIELTKLATFYKSPKSDHVSIVYEPLSKYKKTAETCVCIPKIHIFAE